MQAVLHRDRYSPASVDADDRVERYRVAYEVSIDSLKDQRSRLDSIRSRAVTLLAVAVALGAFLGERLLDHAPGKALDVGWGPFNSRLTFLVALVAFLVVMASAIYTWWPLKHLLELRAETVIDHLIDETESDIGQSYAELAGAIEKNLSLAGEKIHKRQIALAAAMGALGIALVALLLTLWDLG